MTTRRVLPYGDRAVLVECADLADTRALQAWLEDHLPNGVTEVVAGARTLLLRLSEPPSDALARSVLEAEPAPASETTSPSVSITVDYDGDDLAEVADLTGLSVEQVISAHTDQTWTVAFCGFAPGFAYLAGSDDRLRVPRRSSPRTKVPPGSVGLADEWSGIYPRSAPGGWQLIGRTAERVWDLDRDPPALLQPGMRVRFIDRHRVDAAEAGPS